MGPSPPYRAHRPSSVRGAGRKPKRARWCPARRAVPALGTRVRGCPGLPWHLHSRALWPIARVEWGFDMRMRGRTRALALAVVLTTAAVAGIALPAHASSYPSWSDVQNARQQRIREGRRGEADRGPARREPGRGAAHREGRRAAGRRVPGRTRPGRRRERPARRRQGGGRRRPEAREGRAQRAGLLAAQLSRTGGTDLGTTLFFSAGSSNADASSFLSKLGRLSKLTQSNGAIAAEAKQTQRTASRDAGPPEGRDDRARRAQAEGGRRAGRCREGERRGQRRAPEGAGRPGHPRRAAEGAAGESASEFAGYQAGLRAARARAAAAAAAAAGGGGGGGSVASSGWALPAYGPITDGFGYRPDRPAGANPFHRGTDIGAGCGSPIYAAHSGTVIYASPLGTYGNFIEIDNGGGVSTGYAHIRPGGTFVHVGSRCPRDRTSRRSA